MVHSVTCASVYCAHTGRDLATLSLDPADDGCHAPHSLRQQQLLGADDRDGLTRHPPVDRGDEDVGEVVDRDGPDGLLAEADGREHRQGLHGAAEATRRGAR
jgi:hypothetical protein